MSTPQSGVTSCAMNSRMLVQIRSSIGQIRSGRAAGGDPGHSSDEPATRT